MYAYRPSENSRARADRNNPVCPVSLSPAFPLLNLTQARARRSIRVRFYLLATASSTVEEGEFSSPAPLARPSELSGKVRHTGQAREFSSTGHDLASCRARLNLLATATATVEEGKFSSCPPPARPSEFVNWRSHLQLLKKAVVRNHPASPSLARKLEQCEQCSTHERNLGTSPAIAA